MIIFDYYFSRSIIAKKNQPLCAQTTHITMQIGHQFKVVKLQMEHVFQIIMDHQQDNAFKMEQMVFGVQMLLILAMVVHYSAHCFRHHY